MNIQKCAIVGCGAVGATAAYTLLGSGLFNELVLIDINQKKAEGEAMDIGHGVPFIHPVEIYAGTYEDFGGCVSGDCDSRSQSAAGRVEDQSDRKNCPDFSSPYSGNCPLQYGMPAAYCCQSGGYSDNCGLTSVRFSTGESYRQRNSTGFFQVQVPSGRVYRYRPPQCSCIYYWEHGDSEVAVWSSATVSGIAVRDFCDELGIVFTREQMDEIVRDVKNSAYEIIEKKGSHILCSSAGNPPYCGSTDPG